MKVLITGKNSFVGNYVGPYLIDKGYQVEYVSLKDNVWIDNHFSLMLMRSYMSLVSHMYLIRVKIKTYMMKLIIN
jgi:nucleoside-diphosphate-sugar epimerase